MKIPAVLMNDEGGTCFGETDLFLEAADFAPPSPPGYWVSSKLGSEAVCVIRTLVGYADAWYPVPQRMFVILLSGRLRLETTDGDHRIIETGGMFINEDERPWPPHDGDRRRRLRRSADPPSGRVQFQFTGLLTPSS